MKEHEEDNILNTAIFLVSTICLAIGALILLIYQPLFVIACAAAIFIFKLIVDGKI